MENFFSNEFFKKYIQYTVKRMAVVPNAVIDSRV